MQLKLHLKQLDASRLEVKSTNNWALGANVISHMSVAALWIGANQGIYSLGSRSLTCDRRELKRVDCTVENRYLWGTRLESQDLTQVQRAILKTETSTDDKGNTSYRYSMTLTSAQGVIPIDTGFGKAGGTTAQIAVGQVNSFLESSTPQMVIAHDTRFDVETYLRIIVCALFSVIMMWFQRNLLDLSISEIWIFNRALGRAERQKITVRHWLWGQQQNDSYPISALVRIEIENAKDPTDDESTDSYSLYVAHQTLSPFQLLSGPKNLAQIQTQAKTLGVFLTISVVLEPILSRDRSSKKLR